MPSDLLSRGHLALALEHVDLHVGLAVDGGGVDLRLLGGDGGVAGDHLGHHSAEGLHAQGERGDVEQQDVLDLTGQHPALDGGTHGHHLIGVDGLVGGLGGDPLDQLEDGGDAGGAAHHHDLVEFAGGELGVLEGLLHRHAAAVDQLAGQLLELGPGEGEVEVLGPSGVAVMKGRLISAWVALESSILAFSAASVSRCRACLS